MSDQLEIPVSSVQCTQNPAAQLQFKHDHRHHGFLHLSSCNGYQSAVTDYGQCSLYLTEIVQSI